MFINAVELSLVITWIDLLSFYTFPVSADIPRHLKLVLFFVVQISYLKIYILLCNKTPADIIECVPTWALPFTAITTTT